MEIEKSTVIKVNLSLDNIKEAVKQYLINSKAVMPGDLESNEINIDLTPKLSTNSSFDEVELFSGIFSGMKVIIYINQS